ncbi:MAG: hypothetical protein VKO44_03975, partial [Cyanobacteriota bacterium]|nr:hypothetical protein [Cyanobacteriota bacterium]
MPVSNRLIKEATSFSSADSLADEAPLADRLERDGGATATGEQAQDHKRQHNQPPGPAAALHHPSATGVPS